MFEVTVGDRLYRVSFEYYLDESRDPRDWDEDTEVYQMVRYTRANLYLMQGGEKLLVAFADTACSVTENFVKEVGRKHALSRLILTEPEPPKGTITVLDERYIPDFRDKALRSAFWSTYFGRQSDDRIKNYPKVPGGGWPAMMLRRIDSAVVGERVGDIP